MKVLLTLLFSSALAVNQLVLAYSDEDVRRLLETNSCERCDLRQATFTKADLKYANLSGADLERADLTGADLTGADLTGADLSHAVLVGSDFSGASLNEAGLSLAYLYKAKFVKANLSNANLVGARFGKTDFTDADLVGADLGNKSERRPELDLADVGIVIRQIKNYPRITSFDVSGNSKYMTSKSGQLYKSKKEELTRYGDYIRSYPDLTVAYDDYKKRFRTKLFRIISKDLSIDEWGKRHWEIHGQNENRELSTFPEFEIVLDLNEDPTFRSDQEVGLLSVATRDNLIYLSYTVQEGEGNRENVYLVVDEFSETLDKIRTIIKVRTASFSHVAGTLVFDHAGNLYLSIGEGRISDFEPQNLDSLLGKILRFDISKTEPKPVIIASGLRNPWKISIDSKGRMFIGDCGESDVESVYLLKDLSPAMPYNLGWPVFEGTERMLNTSLQFHDTLPPIYEYRHHNGIGICAIGGYFLDDLGIYIFGDYLGRIKLLRESKNGKWREIYSQDTRGVLSLGYDEERNYLYMSSWEYIYQLEISREKTKFLPHVVFCRTVMPDGVRISPNC